MAGTACALAGAINAKRCRWIKLQALVPDALAALNAVTVVALLKTIQSGFDFLQFEGPAPGRLHRHCLTLQRIHARQPPLAALVQFNRIAGLHASGIELFQLDLTFLQPFDEVPQLFPETIGHGLPFLGRRPAGKPASGGWS